MEKEKEMKRKEKKRKEKIGKQNKRQEYEVSNLLKKSEANV